MEFKLFSIVLFYLVVIVHYIGCASLPDNKNMTSVRSYGYHDKCTVYQNCDLYQICVSGICQCNVGYKYNKWQRQCILRDCDSDYYCEKYYGDTNYDTNKVCFKGKCYCDVQYREDFSGLVPVCKRYWDTCSSNSGCAGLHRKCVDGECHCETNYKWDYQLEKCVKYECEHYYDCNNLWEISRKCYQGKCVCDTDYKENSSNGNKCEHSSDISLGSWLWAVIVFPIVFVITAVVLILYYRRRRRQTPGTVIYAQQSVPQQNYVYRS